MCRSFVVKNGSKMRWRVSPSMPTPVSETTSATWGPIRASACVLAYAPSSVDLAVSIVIVPAVLASRRARSLRG